MARLILIRHGESVANAEKRFTRDPEEPLSHRGAAQARATGQQVRAFYRPVAVYASPYERAIHTARLIGEGLRLNPVVIERLREQSFGRFQGETYASYAATYPPTAEENLWYRIPPGGESLHQVAGRAGPALDRLAHRHGGQDVVVVSHGGVMAALRGHAQRDFESPPMPTPNAEGYVLLHTTAGYEGPFTLFVE